MHTGLVLLLETIAFHAPVLADLWERLDLPSDGRDSPELRSAYHAACRVLESEPNNPAAYFMRGVVLQCWQHYDRAACDFAMALKLQPENERAMELLSETLCRLGRLDEARALRELCDDAAS